MKKSSIVLLLVFGLFSFATLVYFYFTQRNFTQNQREFLINLDTLDNYTSDITSELLKNALYAYSSQDKIAQEYDAIQNRLKKLKKSRILEDEKYAHIKSNIEDGVQDQVDALLQEMTTVA
jgi:bisphosphoglycerate-independent phosphoglycerate mutase (AlkP superfamily)